MAQEISQKINILELHSSMSFSGGGQRVIVTFAKHLDKSLFNVFAGSYMVGGFQQSRFQEMGVPSVAGDGNPEAVLQFIRENKIDVLHIHRSGHHVPIESAIIEGAKKINPQLVVIEKNVFGKFDPISGSAIDCSFFQSMMHVNERFLPASGMTFDFDRMKVLYNPINIEPQDLTHDTAEDIAQYKERLGIGPDDFVIGKIARAHIAKWSDLVLDAMPYLVKLVPNVKFILVGVPNSRKRRIERSKYKDHFIIYKEIDDWREECLFFQAIDVLAHSSKIGECNGNTINDAMYWKKPVVVNSTPHKDNGQLEQVERMKTGIVANYPQTFARALAYLHDNPQVCMDMGVAGHDRVARINDPATIVRQLEKVCVERLSEKGRVFGQGMMDFYGTIGYYPNEDDIVGYREEYKKRLQWEFGDLSVGEKIINFLRKPIKFYYKIADFLEHRLG